MLLLADGELDPRIKDDPRLSVSQVEALTKVAELDPEAQVLGLDAKMRPVLRALLPTGQATYALLRNGDPAKPVMPYTESWRARGRRRGTN